MDRSEVGLKLLKLKVSFCCHFGLSDAVRGYLKFPIEAKIGSVPVTTATECQNVISLDHSDYVIITLEPVITTSMNPTNVMATISRTAFVCHYTYQLVITRVEARVERPIEQLIMLFNLLIDPGSFCLSSDELASLSGLLLFLFLLHFDIATLGLSSFSTFGLFLFLFFLLTGQPRTILLFSVGCLKFAALQQ